MMEAEQLDEQIEEQLTPACSTCQGNPWDKVILPSGFSCCEEPEFGKEVTESQMGPGQKIEPDWLICPICKNLMFQPVILQSGDSCCDMIKCIYALRKRTDCSPISKPTPNVKLRVAVNNFLITNVVERFRARSQTRNISYINRRPRHSIFIQREVRQSLQRTNSYVSGGRRVTDKCLTNCITCEKMIDRNSDTARGIHDLLGLPEQNSNYMWCVTPNVVYGLYCDHPTCDKVVYVGQTNNGIKGRLMSHISGIRNNRNTAVAIHFNQNGHNIGNMKLIILEKARIKSKTLRELKETIWMYRLRTITPNGLNKRAKRCLWKWRSHASEDERRVISKHL